MANPKKRTAEAGHRRLKMTMAEAAGYAGMPVATLRDWFNNKPGKPPPPFAMATGDISARPGGTRMLSLHTTLAVIIAAALTRLSIPISRAAVAGMTFAHGRSGNPRRRHVGALYLNGAQTYMVLHREGPCKILPVRPDDLISFMTTIGTGATVLWLDPGVRLLTHAHDLDTDLVLQPYPHLVPRPPTPDEEAGRSLFGWWEPETEFPADDISVDGETEPDGIRRERPYEVLNDDVI